jgi:hypothetical protein
MYAGNNGTIRQDPLFSNSTKYHLSAGSPCIDMGNNRAQGLPATDFEGDTRVVDGDGDGTAVVDMGADEYIPAIPFLYSAVTPCRIVDTRLGGGGIFYPGQRRE